MRLKYILPLSLIALALLLTSCVEVKNTNPLVITLPSGAKCVKNQNGVCVVDSTTASSYTCDEELCVGWCVFKCDVPTTEPKVVFRTNAASSSDYDDSGKWFVTNCAVSNNQCIETTDLISYCRDSSFTSTCDVTTRIKDILFGTSLYARSSYLYINTKGHCRKYSLCSVGETTKTSLEPYKSNNQEMYDSQQQYTCTYNLEVSSDVNWGFKNKIRTETYSWTYDGADKKDFTQNNIISCSPLDYKNTPLPTEKSTIYIEKYSLACATECQQSQSYCRPKQTTVVLGRYGASYAYAAGNRCDDNCATDCVSVTPSLCGSSNYCYECRGTGYDNSYYLKCDGTKTVSNVVCNDWKTEDHCLSGKVCKLVSTNDVGTGLGYCDCLASGCDNKPVGYKKADTTNNNIYYKCCNGGGSCTSGSTACSSWSSSITCDSGLIFSEAKQDCDCNNPCTDYKSECMSDTKIRTCTSITISGKNCWNWVEKNALGDTSKYPRTCKSSGSNAWFECISQQCNNINEKQCVGNELRNCERDADSGCLYPKLLGTKNKCCIDSAVCNDGLDGTKDECINNDCKNTNDINLCNDNDVCTEDTLANGKCTHTSKLYKDGGNCCKSGSDCPAGSTCNLVTNICEGIPDYCDAYKLCTDNEKTCVTNRCKCKTTFPYCNSTQKGTKVCVGNTIYQCNVVVGSDCPQLQNPEICGENFRCIAHSDAICESISDIYFKTSSKIGIGQAIDATVLFNNDDYNGETVQVFIYEFGKTCSLQSTTDCINDAQQKVTNRQAIASFEGFNMEKNIVLQAYVKDKVITKNINILPALKIVPFTEKLIYNVGEEILLEVNVYKLEGATETPITPSYLSVDARLDGQKITDVTSIGNVYKIIPANDGIVSIKVTATHQNYISAEVIVQNIQVMLAGEEKKVYLGTVEQSQWEQDTLGSYVADVGPVTLKYEFSKGGKGLKMHQKDIVIVPPAGKGSTITDKYTELYCDETSSKPCVYVYSVDFKEAGYQYDVVSKFRRIGEQEKIYPLTFVTLGSSDKPIVQTFWEKYWEMFLIGGIVILAIILITILLKRKRKG